jgi:hypothetical protein
MTATERLIKNEEPAQFESIIYQNVSSVGDGTGVTDLIGAAPADYYVIPPAGEIYRLKRMTIAQIDANFNTATGYGAGAALTVGIKITAENAGGVLTDYTPVPIKRTYDWSLLAGVDASTTGGAGADANLVRWTFARGCSDMLLDGNKGEFLRVSFGDPMDFMTSINIQVQGCRV